MKAKRIIVLADMHCGHRAGLAMPPWFASGGTDYTKKILTMQREMWSAFKHEVDDRRPFDGAIWNGDLIDGRAPKNGGLDLIVHDRNEQVEMATRIVEFVGAKKNRFVLGTPFHTGHLEDWERNIARPFGGNIKPYQFMTINGLVVAAKHKVGGGQTPYTRLTALQRVQLWNKIWSRREKDGQPDADIMIRSHVHFYSHIETELGHGFTTHALQAAWTDYGARECEGTVDFGFSVLTVNNRRSWEWERVDIPLSSVKAEVTEL